MNEDFKKGDLIVCKDSLSKHAIYVFSRFHPGSQKWLICYPPHNTKELWGFNTIDCKYATEEEKLKFLPFYIKRMMVG